MSRFGVKQKQTKDSGPKLLPCDPKKCSTYCMPNVGIQSKMKSLPHRNVWRKQEANDHSSFFVRGLPKNLSIKVGNCHFREDAPESNMVHCLTAMS